MAEDEPFRFEGFSAPNYTQVPDALFDVLLPELTESELKVLLYIIRRTFGFKKETDTISLKQMVEGIRTRDGRQLDRGAGVSKTSAVRGVSGLVEKGVIVANRNRSNEKGDQPTTYSLRFRESPVSRFETPPCLKLEHPLVSNLDPQETEEQETVRQEVSNDSKGRSGRELLDEETLRAFVEDYARELNDQAAIGSTLTRVLTIYRQSGRPLEDFLDIMQAARLRTQKRSGSIRAEPVGEGLGRKPKMAYFLAVLSDLALGGDRSKAGD